MQFDISIHCLALTPLTYGVKLFFLALFTLFFMGLMKRKVLDPGYQSLPGLRGKAKVKKHFAIMGFALYFALMVRILTSLSMALSLSAMVRGQACIHFIAPNTVEFFIPFMACLFTAFRYIPTPHAAKYRYSFLVILVLLGCASFVLAAPGMWEYVRFYS